MSGTPTPEEFRAAGFTAAAIDFPMSERAFLWLCQFNGCKPDQAPRAWRYAPNPYMQNYCDRKAEEEGL